MSTSGDNEDTSSAGGDAASDTHSQATTASNITTNSNNNATNTNSSTNNNSNASRGRGNHAGKDKLISSEQKSFSGAMKDFKNVLGMRYEQDLENKVNFEEFKRNFISHVECNSTKYGNELADFLRTGKDPKDGFSPPSSSKKKADLTYIEELELKAQFDIYHAATQGGALDRGMKDLYNMVWGQCSNTLQGAITRRSDYNTESVKRNVKWLMTNLKEELSGIDKKSNPYSTWWAALRKLVNMRQGQQESASDFLKRQREAVDIFELAGGKGSLFSETIAGFSLDSADK